LQILYLLILSELAEVRSDFTAEYITGRIASQVTVLRMNQSKKSSQSSVFSIQPKTKGAGSFVSSHGSEEAVVVGMGADPEPSDHRAVEQAECAIAEADAYGIDVFCAANFLKSQARVRWICAK